MFLALWSNFILISSAIYHLSGRDIYYTAPEEQRHKKDQTSTRNQEKTLFDCNSMPFGAAWAYYGKVLVLVSAASLNGRVHGEVK